MSNPASFHDKIVSFENEKLILVDEEVLLQQRSEQKRLWPMYWSNACCSHPRRGEYMSEAINRRLHQELGLTSDLEFLFKFIYRAQYDETGAEHELCWVYLGRSSGNIAVNANEIVDWRYVSVKTLDHELATQPDKFTPWMKLEWRKIREEHSDRLRDFAAAS